MDSRVRYGVLSTAQIARNQHVPAARESRRSEIVAISSRDVGRARAVAEELRIARAYGSYEELIADDGIDAVLNPLPNALHCEWTVKAAEVGKHVLCEKPLAMDVAQCRRMIDACAANGVLLYEAFTQHFTPMMERIHEIVASGELGDVNMIKAELSYTITDWEHDVRVLKELGGGALYDAGCYCVNTVRTIMGGEPTDVSAAERIRRPNETDSVFTGLLRFPGNRLAFVATSQEQPFRWPLEVIGTKGVLATDNVFAAKSLTVRGGDGSRTEEFAPVNRFALQLDHFSAAIADGAQLRVVPEDGLRNVAVLAALKESARTGRVVRPDAS